MGRVEQNDTNLSPLLCKNSTMGLHNIPSLPKKKVSACRMLWGNGTKLQIRRATPSYFWLYLCDLGQLTSLSEPVFFKGIKQNGLGWPLKISNSKLMSTNLESQYPCFYCLRRLKQTIKDRESFVLNLDRSILVLPKGQATKCHYRPVRVLCHHRSSRVQLSANPQSINMALSILNAKKSRPPFD